MHTDSRIDSSINSTTSIALNDPALGVAKSHYGDVPYSFYLSAFGYECIQPRKRTV